MIRINSKKNKKTKQKNQKNKQVNIVKNKIKKPIHEKIGVQKTTMQIVYAIFLGFFAVLMLFSAFNLAGKVGGFIYNNLSDWFGVGFYIFPTILAISSYILFKDLNRDFGKTKIFSAVLFVLANLGLIELIFEKAGVVGKQIVVVKDYIGPWMSGLFFLILVAISLVIIFDGIPVIKRRVHEFSEYLNEEEEEKIEKIQKKLEKTAVEEKAVEKEEKKNLKVFNFSKKTKNEEPKKEIEEKKENDFIGEMKAKIYGSSTGKTVLPPISLLAKDKGKADAGNIKENANIIKNTLASFGIQVEIKSVMVGPRVTRYEFKPAQGVKLSKISSLHDNLALALATPSIVIKAPIPGKALVGIEVPNKKGMVVGAASLFASEEFKNSKYVLPMALGKNIEGKPEIMSLEEAPHVLVAGQTGAGKSVTVHAMIVSLLYKHGPDSLKFIMVDPKKVEFPVYNGIPHMITPVIKEAKKVILSLKWAVQEMERRYSVLEKNGLRNIKNYHEKIYQKALEKGVSEEKMPEKMPYIVIILDELADIMQKYPKELEAGIAALAQKARAVGIHLIISTQRPTVNVVTGLIKANVPGRIALSVASSLESRTILDESGAEKLLGKGDMLYKDGKSIKPKRVQSAFISEEEVKKVVDFIKKEYKNELLSNDTEIKIGEEDDREKRAESESEWSEEDENNYQENYSEDLMSESKKLFQSDIEIDFDALDVEDNDIDDKYVECLKRVVMEKKASTSFLQRKTGIGYNRAARIIDDMEEKGIIGPQNGSKPREVYWSDKDLQKFLEENNLS